MKSTMTNMMKVLNMKNYRHQKNQRFQSDKRETCHCNLLCLMILSPFLIEFVIKLHKINDDNHIKIQKIVDTKNQSNE